MLHIDFYNIVNILNFSYRFIFLQSHLFLDCLFNYFKLTYCTLHSLLFYAMTYHIYY